ncbi:MAG: hypothetical protein JW910_10650 [Anaerolineae bacterium]|nr:hypothetical protein [Anaerolineae bacterium]
MPIEKIAWGGWQNCYRLSNDVVEVIVTADVGPRVISYRLLDGGKNVLNVKEDTLGKTGGDEWRIYGGHRLWHAPEHPVRTYVPDNGPVAIEVGGQSATFRAPVEAATGIQKTVTLTLGDDTQVRVQHALTNQGPWPVELAVWALSVMAVGGVGIVPLPERGTHPADLLPNTQLIFWSYCDLSDPRWTFGREYILLRQDVHSTAPQKFGGRVLDGWIAYANGGTLFAKTFADVPGAAYPDLGCSAELFSCDWMLEMETLAPLVRLEPGSTATHDERWALFPDVPTPQNDADVKAHVQPLIDGLLAE